MTGKASSQSHSSQADSHHTTESSLAEYEGSLLAKLVTVSLHSHGVDTQRRRTHDPLCPHQERHTFPKGLGEITSLGRKKCLKYTCLSPSFSLHTQTIRGVWGDRRCPPSDDQWGEGYHCQNTAAFAQMYSALLTENTSSMPLNRC